MVNNKEFNYGKDWEIRAWLKFLENTKNVKSGKKLTEFFDNLLSENEKKIIIRRIVAISMIRAGKSYKEIGRILWISSKTISAIKKSVLNDYTYKSGRYYSEKSDEEKRKRIKPLSPRTIVDYWANMPWPTKSGKGRWKYLNYQD
ncbi:MAG: hypothetical protein D4Q79_00670 [Spirochaetia bacterium]|nr:MAG: hypothetical protein D4Q79_00670 [Spirochaetia bacterium]